MHHECFSPFSKSWSLLFFHWWDCSLSYWLGWFFMSCTKMALFLLGSYLILTTVFIWLHDYVNCLRKCSLSFCTFVFIVHFKLDFFSVCLVKKLGMSTSILISLSLLTVSFVCLVIVADILYMGRFLTCIRCIHMSYFYEELRNKI